jgi:uncharacterized membrane protein
MFDAIVLWLHILAAVAFVGPQIFLAAVAMPAVRSIEDARARQQVTRSITRGFGALGGVALGVAIVTGIWNYAEADDKGLLDLDRYFAVMQVKLTLVTIAVILTVLHGAVLGRRLQRLQESGAPADEVAAARRWSMMASLGTLAVSIGVLFCAALLPDWARQ